MFLKRHNWIALLLLLLASVCWVFGFRMARSVSYGGIQETTYPGDRAEATQAPVVPSRQSAAQSEDGTTPGTDPEASQAAFIPEAASRSRRAAGAALCFLAAAGAVLGVFRYRQKEALLGPDGAAGINGICGLIRCALDNMEYIAWTGTLTSWYDAVEIFSVFVFLAGLRELWGWLRAGRPLSWCLVQRIARRCRKPRLALLTYAGWILAAFSGVLSLPRPTGNLPPIACFAAAGVLGALCLRQYGRDLEHFREQLDHFQKGLPIAAGDGSFGEYESQLLTLQAEHARAVQAAAAGERFKVELIANVSHDLRTPLTAILGYSELLQKETLSPQGQEQLRRLCQKAGYMRELVESLFELTKVSSGVMEAKKEEIDLVRLLEQTVGLFGDQLSQAGLAVRRSYCSAALPIVTDGARMHQVFANLLGNAIKYALPGTRIYLEVREETERFSVRMVNTASYEMDFRPEEILQRFARGDKARSTQGSGLGLAIAQTYTSSVGGLFRVSVDGDQFSAIVELPKIERKM